MAVAANRRLSVEREKSVEKKLSYQPGSYPSSEANNNPQIYENIESYIAGEFRIGDCGESDRRYGYLETDNSGNACDSAVQCRENILTFYESQVTGKYLH